MSSTGIDRPAGAVPTSAGATATPAGAGAGAGAGVPGTATGAPVSPTTTARTRASRIPALLKWQNPVRTGTVLAQVVAVLLVLRYGNLLRTALRVMYWATGATLLVEFVSRATLGNGLVSQFKPSRYIRLNESTLEKYSSRLIRLANNGLNEVKSLFDAEDLTDSALAFIGFVLLYILTGFVSVSTLLIVTTVAAFSLPKLYLTFQKEFDQVINLVQEHVHHHASNVHKQVHAVAGPHIETAKKHVGGIADRFGYARGVPETPKSAPTGVAPPGASAVSHDSIPASVKSPKVPSAAPSAAGVGAATGAAADPGVGVLGGAGGHTDPVISAAQRTVDGVTYDSVPSLVGNVNLAKPGAESPVASAAGKAPEAAPANGAAPAPGSGLPDLAAELKDSINFDKSK